MKLRTILTFGALFAGALTLNPGAACADVVRYPIPNSTFPIAQAVQVSGFSEWLNVVELKYTHDSRSYRTCAFP
jgi:hypothetical protein